MLMANQFISSSYKQMELAAMQQNINVSRFAAGAYFVQLITDKDTKTAKFVKQ